MSSTTTTKGSKILRTNARDRAEMRALSGWIMLISSPLRRRHWHNRSSSEMSTANGDKRRRSCRIQQHNNVRMKCFIWIVAWLCNTLSQTYANHSIAISPLSSQTSLMSTSAPLNMTTVPYVSRDTLLNSGKYCNSRWYGMDMIFTVICQQWTISHSFCI